MLITGSSPSNYHDIRVEDPTWDYRGFPTKSLTHGFHSYPAMMIPQVANRLIEQFSKPGDVLLDPFCGSGSVLVEARINRRYSWGIDLNPLAVLIACVKTTPIKPAILQQELQTLVARIASCDGQAYVPDFFNLRFWFKDSVITNLAKIRVAIDAIKRKDVKSFFQVAYSETVRLSSNSRSHEFKLFRYAEDKLENHNPDPIALFIDKATSNIEAMYSFHMLCPVDIWAKPIEADSTQPNRKIKSGSIDIVVTSPPYGDSRTTVAYGQFSRLSSQWLGLLPERVSNLDNEMLGGRILADRINLISPTLNEVITRIKETEDTKRAGQVYSYYVDLNKCLKRIADYLRVGGYACIIVGNRRVKGVQLPTDIVICELAENFSMEPQQIIVRTIPSKTMPLKNSPTNVKGVLEETMHKEYIVVMRKGE